MNSKKRYLKLALALAIVVVVCVVAKMQNEPNAGLFSRDLFGKKHKAPAASGSIVTIDLSTDKTSDLSADLPIVLSAQLSSSENTGPLRFGWRVPQGVQVVSGDLTTQLPNLSPSEPVTLKLTVILHTTAPLRISAYGVFNKGDAFLRTMALLSLNTAPTPKQ
jgi:hypothetical protein